MVDQLPDDLAKITSDPFASGPEPILTWPRGRVRFCDGFALYGESNAEAPGLRVLPL